MGGQDAGVASPRWLIIVVRGQEAEGDARAFNISTATIRIGQAQQRHVINLGTAYLLYRIRRRRTLGTAYCSARICLESASSRAHALLLSVT